MGEKELIDLLAQNLERLMEAHNLKSNMDVQKKTSLSKAQVHNLRNANNAATLKSIALLSEGFGVPPWSMIHANGPAIYKDPRIGQIIEAFTAAPEDGRDVILRVAESQAQYRPD